MKKIDNRLFSPIVQYIENRPLFVLIMAILIIGFVVYWDFFTFQKFYLFKDIGSDSLNASYPYFVHLSHYLREWGFPGWSFNVGLGQNILPFSLGDPFNDILFILGADKVVYFVFYIEFIKILLSGILFYLFLSLFSLNPISCIISGLFYAFSSYIVIGGGWNICSTEAVYAALILFAVEILISRRVFYWLPLSIALLAAYLSFHLYFYGLLLIIYVIFRFLTLKSTDFKVLKQFTFIIALSILGVMISTIFLIPNVIQYFESPRVGGSESYFSSLAATPIFTLSSPELLYTSLLRFFSNDLLGTGSNFLGWTNYFEAPMYYIGLISFLLFLSFYFKSILKNRTIFIAISLFSFFPLVVPYFRYSFWLFTGDYFRTYSFFISLIIVTSSAFSLSSILNGGQFGLKSLFIAFIICQILLLIPDFFHFYRVIQLQNIIRLLLILYFVLIILVLKYPQYRILTLVLLLSSIFEITYFTSMSIDGRVNLTKEDLYNRIGYNDVSTECIKYLKENDSSFYRIEKDFGSSPAIHMSINDGMVQNYFGTTSYNSFNQKYYIRFLRKMGIVSEGNEYETRWAVGTRSHPLLQSLVGVKYCVSNQDISVMNNFGYFPIFSVEDYTVYRNEFQLPLGFCYDKFLNQEEIGMIKQPVKDILLMKGCVIENNDTKSMSQILTNYKDLKNDIADNYDIASYRTDIDHLKSDTLKIVDFNPNKIMGEIELKNPKLLFFSIPYDPGWTAYCDGYPINIKLVNYGFMGLLLDSGFHDIELVYQPRHIWVTSLFTVIGLFLFVLLFSKSINQRLIKFSKI